MRLGAGGLFRPTLWICYQVLFFFAIYALTRLGTLVRNLIARSSRSVRTHVGLVAGDLHLAGVSSLQANYF